jgi:positive regulator of sigma E activity
LIEQQARVTQADGTNIRVLVGGQSGCVACDEGKGCGAGLFGRLLNRKPLEINLKNQINAETGQAVLLGLPEHIFLKLVFRLYGWPLIAGLIGAVAGLKMGQIAELGTGGKDFLTAGCAIVFAFSVLIFAKRTANTDIKARDIKVLDKPVTDNRCVTG